MTSQVALRNHQPVLAGWWMQAMCLYYNEQVLWLVDIRVTIKHARTSANHSSPLKGTRWIAPIKVHSLFAGRIPQRSVRSAITQSYAVTILKTHVSLAEEKHLPSQYKIWTSLCWDKTFCGRQFESSWILFPVDIHFIEVLFDTNIKKT